MAGTANAIDQDTNQFLKLSGDGTVTGNVTLTNAAASTNRSLIVDNTSNTANSNSFCESQVAGGTAGDAYFVADINLGQAWSWGLDNSDSDAFALSNGALGITNVMRISTGNEINYPLQPAFMALLSTSPSNVTGNNTIYTIVPDTEIYDQNSDYNNATGIFTAPITGRYLFSCGVTWMNIAGTSVNFTIVTSNRTWTFITANGTNLRDASANLILQGSCFIDMDAADTAIFQTTVNGVGADTVDVLGDATTPYTFFSGALIC